MRKASPLPSIHIRVVAMVDVNVGSATALTAGMAAAATLRSAAMAQTHVLRGSLASQSLAADISNAVFSAMETAEEPNGLESVTEATGGDMTNFGNKAVETVAIQAIAAAVPALFKAVLKGCEKRRPTEDPANNGGNEGSTPKKPSEVTPKKPQEMSPNKSLLEVSPLAPIHHKMSDGSSEGEFDVDGFDLDSRDLRDSSLDRAETGTR